MIFRFVSIVSILTGKSVFWNPFIEKYHKLKEGHRIFMFLDFTT